MKNLSLGNGNMLINLDQHGLVRDLYYPYCGLENQVGGHFKHRIGIWVDGDFSWLDDGSWQINLDCQKDTFAGAMTAVNSKLAVTLHANDSVYNEKNIFIRRLTVINNENRQRKIKIYFGQEFELYESHTAHTAYFDPHRHLIIHYRNQRVFAINAQMEGKSFDDYSTGVFSAEGKRGTFVDAEDGQLAKNPIEHGQADSVIGLTMEISAGEEKHLYYWLSVGQSIKEVVELNEYVLNKGAGYLIKTASDYWRAWVGRQNFSFHGLDSRLVELFNKSLFYIRAHVNANGSIIASGDSGMLQKGKDTYAYMWPRDASYAVMALDRAGDFNVSRKYFELCSQIISDGGYFMHKYSPDGSLGSSWHGWLVDGVIQLPIQEDETAIVLHSLWQHYQMSKDLELIENLYNSLIREAGNFLVLYRDSKTGLPKPSYDLWEERFGVYTYSASAVYGGLKAAANFARLLGKTKSEFIYQKAADDIKVGILKHLWSDKDQTFRRGIEIHKDGTVVNDNTADASAFFGVMQFGVLPIDDERLVKATENISAKLLCQTKIGGMARYEDDKYYQVSKTLPGNPWVITTLWYVQFLIARAEKESDLDEVKKWFAWMADRGLESGILPEQVNPLTGEPLSATPLVWSHSEYVATVIKYLDKLEDLGVCIACNPVY